MYYIDENTLEAYLTSCMNNGITWLAPFMLKEIDYSKILVSADTPLVFDSSIRRTSLPLNVKLLPYTDKKIMFVESPKNSIVVSGKFSGCYMGRYWKDDKKFVCHIATGGGTNGECENYFNEIPDAIKFKPSLIIKEIDYKDIIKKKCADYNFIFNPIDDVYGIITYGDELYSLIVAKQNNVFYVMAWAKWSIQNKKQKLDALFAKYDELYPYLASPWN